MRKYGLLWGSDNLVCVEGRRAQKGRDVTPAVRTSEILAEGADQDRRVRMEHRTLIDSGGIKVAGEPLDLGNLECMLARSDHAAWKPNATRRTFSAWK